MTDRIAEHDVVGVGLGPFNLGLAALLEPTGLDACFLEARPEFRWHAGLLLDGTVLQVPFLADLVTLADPTSPHSYLEYLRQHGRLYRFYFLESFHIPRREYDHYCRWVASRLESCRFGRRVVELRPEGDRWLVESVDVDGTTTTLRAGAVVVGVGTAPSVPTCAQAHLGETVVHSAGYATARDRLVEAGSVTVVGSGQSAAEVVLDLLRRRAPGAPVEWYARSRGFLPMEYSKLGLEHFSPEYGAHFHGLSEARRDEVRAGQDLLYKGISAETSADIYDLLYEQSIGGAEPALRYLSGCELTDVNPSPDAERRWRLRFCHRDQGASMVRDTDALVLGTGYGPRPIPVAPELLEHDTAGRPVVDHDFRIRTVAGVDAPLFVQNGELHSHGVGAPDLGLGAHRNSVIVNALCGREVHPVRSRNVFQQFGVPEDEVVA